MKINFVLVKDGFSFFEIKSGMIFIGRGCFVFMYILSHKSQGILKLWELKGTIWGSHMFCCRELFMQLFFMNDLEKMEYVSCEDTLNMRCRELF